MNPLEAKRRFMRFMHLACWKTPEEYSPAGPEVSADYNKGVLKIKLAKKAEAKPKRIKVNVGAEKTPEAKTPEAEAPGKAA